MTNEELELLHRAAKAAGIEVHRGVGFQSIRLFRESKYPTSDLVANVEWNPITDHGDRYRLARACEVRVDFGYRVVIARDDKWCLTKAKEFFFDDDLSEAWAIVKAAAATLGEAP